VVKSYSYCPRFLRTDKGGETALFAAIHYTYSGMRSIDPVQLKLTQRHWHRIYSRSFVHRLYIRPDFSLESTRINNASGIQLPSALSEQRNEGLEARLASQTLTAQARQAYQQIQKSFQRTKTN
jgi:hypothetical protein